VPASPVPYQVRGLRVGRVGDEISDFKNSIGRTFSVRVDSDLSGSGIFVETSCRERIYAFPTVTESPDYPIHRGRELQDHGADWELIQ